MKKLMLTTALMLGMVGMSYAQLSATGDANLKLRIVQAMSMTVTGSVDFGIVTTGTLSVPNVAPTAGAKFEVSGTAGETFQLSALAATVNLSNGGTTPTNITFTPNLVQSPDGITAGSGATSGTTYTLSGTDPTTTGHAYFLLGGSVALTGTEPAGTYAGTYTITATYY